MSSEKKNLNQIQTQIDFLAKQLTKLNAILKGNTLIEVSPPIAYVQTGFLIDLEPQ